MGIETALQTPTTIKGDSSVAPTQTQSITEWQDVGNWANGIYTLWVSFASVSGGDSLSLKLYTCTDKDATSGGSTLLATFSTVTSGSVLKKKAILGQDAWPQERWLYWVLEASSTGGAFEAQFRISNMLKTPA